MSNIKDLKIHSSEGLNIIKASSFLNSSDIGFLVENKPVFQELFENKTIWRSAVEMRISVLSDVKHPDKPSKYRQCVKECDAFHGYLVDLSFEFRRNKVKLEGLKRSLLISERPVQEVKPKGLFSKFKKQARSQSRDHLQQELLRIDIEELEYIIRSQTKQAAERVKELREWILLMSQLDDGTWNKSDLDKAQLLSYTKRFLKQYMINKDTVTGSERTNLVGLLATSLRYCEEKNLLKELATGLNKEEQLELKKLREQE